MSLIHFEVARLPQSVTENPTRVDAAPVAVDDRPGLGPAAPGGNLEGVDNRLGPNVIGDRPADDAAAEHAEDRTAVDLALPRRVLGHVSDPEPVRAVGHELPLDQVLVDRRGRPVTALPAVTDALDAGGAHQPGNSLLPDPMSTSKLEFGMDPRGAIRGPGGGMDVSDLVEEVGVAPVPLRRRPR